MSFWDTGEYITTSSKLQVGHPPGAPLFVIIANFFSNLTFGNTANVAWMINFMSALCSAFTIAFLFWIKGIDIIGANRSGVFLHLMTIFGALMAIVILGEKFMFYHFLGAIFILSLIHI